MDNGLPAFKTIRHSTELAQHAPRLFPKRGLQPVKVPHDVVAGHNAAMILGGEGVQELAEWVGGGHRGVGLLRTQLLLFPLN